MQEDKLHDRYIRWDDAQATTVALGHGHTCDIRLWTKTTQPVRDTTAQHSDRLKAAQDGT